MWCVCVVWLGFGVLCAVFFGVSFITQLTPQKLNTTWKNLLPGPRRPLNVNVQQWHNNRFFFFFFSSSSSSHNLHLSSNTI